MSLCVVVFLIHGCVSLQVPCCSRKSFQCCYISRIFKEWRTYDQVTFLRACLFSLLHAYGISILKVYNVSIVKCSTVKHFDILHCHFYALPTLVITPTYKSPIYLLRKTIFRILKPLYIHLYTHLVYSVTIDSCHTCMFGSTYMYGLWNNNFDHATI